ncbi:hypothetical protein [Streptomyces sp. NPDC058084]|uniref:hypothetical protein n=1 Tax=Streptomyces sp. NPDC058084 TaxID=3346333 RepID=UPI0036E60521
MVVLLLLRGMGGDPLVQVVAFHQMSGRAASHPAVSSSLAGVAAYVSMRSKITYALP